MHDLLHQSGDTPPADILRCRVAACPAGGGSWDFYLINDTANPIETAVLEKVDWEWGDLFDAQTPQVRVTGIPPGGHSLLWRGEDDELRMTLSLVVRWQGQPIAMEFPFPLLYRRRDQLPLVEALGKVGWEVPGVRAVT